MKKSTFTCLVLLLLLCIKSVHANTFNDDRTDFRDEAIYFVITTRFYDGDASNNTQCWDNQTANTGDPAWRGDFKGLIDKMDYIKALGFTAIWITPVVENASGYDYHGYHASNFSKVDKRYESSDVDFQTVIEEAHKRGMKIILDIVLNHTGNFGEEHLCKEFTRDWTANPSDIDACMIPYTKSQGGTLPDDYAEEASGTQYNHRLYLMKNNDGINHDSNNYWHHRADFNWDDYTRWYAQIAGDCVDLNTENPAVYDYLIKCYGSFIKLGVDRFRIDTSGHIPRLAFDKVFVPAFQKLGNEYASKRLNGCPFYMFGEVCARFQGSVTYRGVPALSPYFYTWHSDDALKKEWNSDSTYWKNIDIKAATTEPSLENEKLELQEYNANTSESTQPTSNNVFLNGNAYHTPDYSKASGFNVIDFPVHYSFNNVGNVWGLCTGGDKYYNDASFNVVYVDSHDYSPAPNDGIRFNGGTEQWAENLSFMFTFRGIPCLYYGSEVEFRAGKQIDAGTTDALKNTGRAYFGGYLTGDVTPTGFGTYSNASGNAATTLNQPLAKHIERLSQIRQAVPALRKGQYSTDGCSNNGGYAYKRRYANGTTDSYALVALNGGSYSFTNIVGGTYTECITGETKTVSEGGSISGSFSGKGNMRIWVLNGTGKIGKDGPYLYSTSSTGSSYAPWDGTQENTTSIYKHKGDNKTKLKGTVYTPSCSTDETCVFLASANNSASVWIWNNNKDNYTGGTWPGETMTKMGVNSDSTKYIYKWTYKGSLSTNPSYVIFSQAGNNQTADLAYVNHGYYVDGAYSKTIDAAEEIGSAIVDKTTDSYNNNVSVNVKPSKNGVVVVYTTDGSDPTANSNQITDATNGKTLNFTNTTTLKAGVLNKGKVYNVKTFTYTIITEKVYTVYFDNSASNWSSVSAWAWDNSNTSTNYTGGTWPGKALSIDASTGYYKWSYTGTLSANTKIIFNNGGKGSQTADLTFVDGAIYDINGKTNKVIDDNVIIDKTTGKYNNSVDVNIKPSKSGAIAVYTTDGSEPTANSNQITDATNGKTLHFTQTTTLKAGILSNGNVCNVKSYTYTITTEKTYTVYFDNSFSKWSTVSAWVWDGDNISTNYTGGTWPGKTLSIDASTGYYKWNYTGTLSANTKIIFNNGGKGSQTADLIFEDCAIYDTNGLTNKTVCGVNSISATKESKTDCIKVYTINGVFAATIHSLSELEYTLRPGIYIINGKKYIIK